MSFLNCASTKQKTDFTEITYEAMTRGRSEKITIKENVVYYKTHLKSSTIKLTEKQQEQLKKELLKVNLSEISNLKSPTNKRLFDGAMHTTVSVKKDTKEYISNTFDDTDPPSELNELCTLIKDFVKD